MSETLEIIGKKMARIGKLYANAIIVDDQKKAADMRLSAHECLDAYFDHMQDMINEAVMLDKDKGAL
jgi:hypothetical protein